MLTFGLQKARKNLFGMPVKVVEMQSEAGAAGTVHGSLQMGVLTTTFTASQGLLLKLPNMYKIAGQFFQVLSMLQHEVLQLKLYQYLVIIKTFMAARQTGFAMIASSSVQATMDLAGIAHLAAIKSSVPFYTSLMVLEHHTKWQSIEVD
jgi:pyruvate-ferredoxin/flavodoxin oxidoreductase